MKWVDGCDFFMVIWWVKMNDEVMVKYDVMI